MTSAVAVGVFDGLHRGHQAILKRVRERGQAGGCAVVSFDPHPDLVLSKRFEARAPLTPLPEKRERLAALGIDTFVVIPFTRELASLSPEDFVDQHLIAPFGLTSLVIGENFALGKGRTGNLARLRELGATRGFDVEPVPLLVVDGAPVSSTRIREALSAGRVAEAATLLGRRYNLSGLVVTGDAIGRTLGYPTANLRLLDEKCVPAHGIYAVWARIGAERTWRMGAMSIGIRPTFGGEVRTLEVFLLDWSGDLPGRGLDVELVDWLRPEMAFPSTEDLVRAMDADVAATRRVLAANPPPAEATGLHGFGAL